MKQTTAGGLIAALTVAAAVFLTGCQTASEFDRALYVTALPADAEKAHGQSAGFDVHFGPAAFGLTCSTDTVGDSARGTAAVICTWTTEPR